MALPADGSADSGLSVKGLVTEELTIGPDHEELRGDPDGGIGSEGDENESVHLPNLAKKSCKLGICRSERLNRVRRR